MVERACLIVNPAAGGGRGLRALPDVRGALSSVGVAVRVEHTRDLAHAAELALGAARTGEAALTLGGDGLVGAVAGALRGTSGVAGFLPGGRGNDFVRALGLRTDDPGATCAQIIRGRIRDVDVAEVAGVGAPAGRGFVGIASYGFDSEVQAIATGARVVQGHLVYLYAALRALAAWQPARFEVRLDERRRSFVGYSVAVANAGVYGGGMRLAPRAQLDDGLLDVVLTRRTSKLRFLRTLPRVFRGTHVGDPAVEIIRARQVRLAAARPFTVYADGEPVCQLPATVRVHQRALRVLTPT